MSPTGGDPAWVTQGPPVGHQVGGAKPLVTSRWLRGHAGRKVWGVLDATTQARTSVPTPLGHCGGHGDTRGGTLVF